jgi:hypothetical protein
MRNRKNDNDHDQNVCYNNRRHSGARLFGANPESRGDTQRLDSGFGR